MDVTVAVGTFGAASWVELAHRRAIPSAEQFEVPVVYVHAGTLHDARNQALDRVHTEWVVHLDADDELEAGYVDAMGTGTADLRAPSVRYVRARASAPPLMPRVAGHGHDCDADCLAHGNWLVIGTAVRVELARRVGGWRDFAWSEDWDLWVRCWQAGATVEAIPAAVYRAHVRKGSRNRAPGHRVKHETHQAIARANGLPVPA